VLDLLIRAGSVVDGTGRARFTGDVGIRDGRIVCVGGVDEAARETLDAAGLVVAPGFIDIHTHYDAQVFWDGSLSPSPLHGVTTVIGGNCGFSIAPLSDQSGDYMMRMLARVEAMPLESLREGVPWNWRSFGEYLDCLEGRVGPNAGFLVGHSALRRHVMGARTDQPASPGDIDAMSALLSKSLAAGGLGFSSSLAAAHADGDGNPVPSRAATPEEIVALCRVVGAHPGTTLEFIASIGLFEESDMALMSDMSLAADRPLNWNVLVIDGQIPENAARQLSAGDYARKRGATVVALTPPMLMKLRINLRSGLLFDLLPGWGETMALPLDQRMKALADPDTRLRLEASARDAGLISFVSDWPNVLVDETFEAENEKLRGRTIGAIAAERGVSAFDALLDISLSEGLRTSFLPRAAGDDEASWKLRAELWNDDRLLLGGSDAGAHLDMIDTFTCSTSLLGECVRERGLMSLETAVAHLTTRPARLLGLRGRGRIEVGGCADLSLFDPATVGPGEIHTRYDLPAGAGRLYAESTGIEHVFVGGVALVSNGRLTEALPGRILRSGRDTRTVTNASLRRENDQLESSV
jgi:N-acyl-D-aspartate/D-glutamate deacylase